LTANSILNAQAIPRIDTPEGVAWHLDALTRQVPELAPMRETVGEVMPRVNPKGFAGMAKVICGQQLSVQSAAAIWSRFEAIPGALEPQTYLSLSEEQVRGAGFSLGKFLSLRAVAEAVVAGELNFAEVDALPAEEAIARLVALKGIGPWTAEVYLLFCAAHHGLGLEARPSIKEMIVMAQPWSPHRSAAALLFWRFFAAMKNRAGVLL
jgi:DNA-3-methyladenine glycosylase II